MPTALSVHQHASAEGGIFANAYLVESDSGVVAIDATLTVSESRAFRMEFEALRKPLLAVLVTHAHPDHVAGIGTLVAGSDVPIVALRSVTAMMRAIEDQKRAQWQPIFKDEWIPQRTYPNTEIAGGDVVEYGGMRFRAHDFGAGGDCDANTVWLLNSDPPRAFIGDLVFSGMHSYLSDGRVLAWLANLHRAHRLLAACDTLYPGHGNAGSPEILQQQIVYLITYCAEVKQLAGKNPSLTDAQKQSLIEKMEAYRSTKALEFLIPLGADVVARELAA
jgi:glyoxylase-like metal-dependent hydrolase (beta-lactamase superfamily II)